MWEREKVAVSFANKIELDGNNVTFSRDVISGMNPPTVKVDPDWWYLTNQLVISIAAASLQVECLAPTKARINTTVAVHDQVDLPLSTITPLALVNPPITSPYIPPAAAYTLLLDSTSVWQWETTIAPHIQWI